MNVALIAAAALAALVGLAHSYLGERYLLMRLFRRENLPRLAGSLDFTKQTLRLAWHITTVLALGLAALLVVLASPERDWTRVAQIVAAMFLGCGLVSLITSRGRHLSWIVFFAIAALAWFGGK